MGRFFYCEERSTSVTSNVLERGDILMGERIFNGVGGFFFIGKAIIINTCKFM